jgi:hypothetical protein
MIIPRVLISFVVWKKHTFLINLINEIEIFLFWCADLNATVSLRDCKNLDKVACKRNLAALSYTKREPTSAFSSDPNWKLLPPQTSVQVEPRLEAGALAPSFVSSPSYAPPWVVLFRFKTP